MFMGLITYGMYYICTGNINFCDIGGCFLALLQRVAVYCMTAY